MTPRSLTSTLAATALAALALAGCYAGAGDLLPAAQPRSLAGTEVDGDLRVVAGALVFDEHARRAFDYFLTADDELAPAELDAWVRAELAARVPAAALDDAFAAWRSYVEFRGDAAAALGEPGAELAAVERRLQDLVDAQLGAYPIAADERAQIARAFALKRAAALVGDDRERALADLVEPAPVEAHTFLDGRQATELARLAGADAAGLHAVRAEHFGAAAADRLADLDARRAAWTARVDAYRRARDELLAGFAGTAEQRDAAVAALAADSFSAGELRRLHALERLAGPAPGGE